MISQEWAKLEKKFLVLTEQLRELTLQVYARENAEIAAIMQEELINLGRFMETEYNILCVWGGSEIIQFLEKYCEDLYQFVINGSHEKILLEDVDNLLPALRKSVEIKDIKIAIVAIIPLCV